MVTVMIASHEMNTRFAALLLVFCLPSISAVKKRSWIQSELYFEGVSPAGKVFHGMTSEIGKIFVFGGYGARQGKHRDRKLIQLFFC
jgi:hypothetical protein